jgi:hypothetical protein
MKCKSSKCDSLLGSSANHKAYNMRLRSNPPKQTDSLEKGFECHIDFGVVVKALFTSKIYNTIVGYN